MDQNGDQDSPLSIASNIAGLLTFVFAVAATAYARIRYLQNSSTEYMRVKTSLSWYKTESTWLSYLVDTTTPVPPESEDSEGSERSSVDEKYGAGYPRRRRTGLDRAPAPASQRAEQHMFAFVMDDLLNLEQRLLDMVNDVESRAEPSSAAATGTGISWSLIPGTWHGGRPSVAVAWLGVRTKALELVRQREALTERVQFLQLSMIASRLQTLEGRVSVREASQEADTESLRAAIASQAALIRKLESRDRPPL
ncbi:hypothetical protein PWT90_00336 [Aphanocladium album]|nr:hypothetical protein PWT90_00336 [Aphanocladium album]